MLRRVFVGVTRTQKGFRNLSSSADGKGPKDPSAKDVLGDELLNAVDKLAKDLHGNNQESVKKVKNTLISKLMASEKATFENATSTQASDMLDDKAVIDLLSDVSLDTRSQKLAKPSAAQARQEQRGLVLLRKEIFYQATQSGYKPDEARVIAEKAVQQAQERVASQRKKQKESAETVQSEEAKVQQIENEKERKLYEQAYLLAEKMLYHDDLIGENGVKRKIIREDPNVASLFNTSERLGIWNKLEGSQDRSVGFWTEWDKNAARIMNQSMGPTNAFEEQIGWTEKGKQWTYPINNEYNLGEEEQVSFVEHIFLEKQMKTLGIPKQGPVAHFMHLVCVGLSKNPYMTAKKKAEHLEWFANYFNKEKQDLIEKLHEQEQIAAQNA